MGTAPDFSQTTIDLIAYRSAYICSNPDCNTLTVGPSMGSGELRLKIGEAAHIADARKKTIRFDPAMSDKQRADPSNGIWLCANCHTAVDKNQGIGFPTGELKRWKREHETRISTLLRTHRSPLPLIRRQSMNQALAQEAVDVIADRGAFFEDWAWEEPEHVIKSVEQARYRLQRIRRQILLDARLRDIIGQMTDGLRLFMNHTSKVPQDVRPQLHVLRTKMGVGLGTLRDEYGCSVTGGVTRITAVGE